MRRSSSVAWAAPTAQRRGRSRAASRPNRAWFVVFTVLIGALVGSVVAAIYTSPLLAVHRVRVDIARLPDPWEERAVRARSAVATGVPLAAVDRRALAGRLRALPWVGGVQVRRQFPDRLALCIDVRRPAAVVVAGGRRWEVDENGVAIRPARAGVGLPEIDLAASGAVRAGRVVPAKGLSTALAAVMLSRTQKPLQGARIAVDQNAGICFNNPDAVSVSLGQSDDLLYKLALIRRIYEHRPDIAADIQEVDLRCPEAPACTTRKPDGTPSRSNSSG